MFLENTIEDSENNAESNSSAGKDIEDKLPLKWMPGNNMKTLDNHQTQVNNEAQQKQEKIVCYNPKDER